MRTSSNFLIAASLLAVGLLAWPVAGGDTKEANQSQKLEELLKKRQSTLDLFQRKWHRSGSVRRDGLIGFQG